MPYLQKRGHKSGSFLLKYCLVYLVYIKTSLKSIDLSLVAVLWDIVVANMLILG